MAKFNVTLDAVVDGSKSVEVEAFGFTIGEHCITFQGRNSKDPGDSVATFHLDHLISVIKVPDASA